MRQVLLCKTTIFFLFRNHIRQNAAIAIEEKCPPPKRLIEITNNKINNNHSE